MRHPEGRPWTPDELCWRLVEAFGIAFGVDRSDGRPVATGVLFSPRKGVFIHYQTGRELRGGEVIRLFQERLGRNRHTEMLFAWARAQAGIGPSLSETCRVRGWSRTTVERTRRLIVHSHMTELLAMSASKYRVSASRPPSTPQSRGSFFFAISVPLPRGPEERDECQSIVRHGNSGNSRRKSYPERIRATFVSVQIPVLQLP
jgi:hypothetical protein